MLLHAQEECLFKADKKDCTKRPLNKTQVSAKLNKVITHNLRQRQAVNWWQILNNPLEKVTLVSWEICLFVAVSYLFLTGNLGNHHITAIGFGRVGLEVVSWEVGSSMHPAGEGWDVCSLEITDGREWSLASYAFFADLHCWCLSYFMCFRAVLQAHQRWLWHCTCWSSCVTVLLMHSLALS